MEEFFQVFKAKVERCLELWGLQPWTVTESLLKPKGLVTEWTRLGSHQVCHHRGLPWNTGMAFTNPEDLTPSKTTQNKHHEIFTDLCTASLSHLKTCQNSDTAESPESALHLPHLQSL